MFVQVRRTLRQKEVVRGACFPAVLHDGQNARGTFTILSLQATTDIFRVRGKALRWGHDPVEVHWKALWARGAGTTAG